MLNFLYTTIPGRFILKPLVSPGFSKLAAKYFSSPLSKWLISHYIKKYNINMNEFDGQIYRSFNDFFTRYKQITPEHDEDISAIMPCDGFLSIYTISNNLTMDIKHSSYTISNLLENDMIANRFSGGICCVFRLEPQHYHHYLYAVDGNIISKKRIDGVLHSVRPICCEQYPVWFRNSREYALIDSPIFGNVVQMEIGALLVGKIRNTADSKVAIKGKEKGYFEYGGSTVLLMFERNAITLLPDYMALVDTKIELPVNVGKLLGQKLH